MQLYRDSCWGSVQLGVRQSKKNNMGRGNFWDVVSTLGRAADQRHTVANSMEKGVEVLHVFAHKVFST